MKKIINIIVSVNAKYVKYLLVLMNSLFENHKAYKIDLYILHSELTEAELKKLELYAYEFGNEVIPVKIEKDKFKKFRTNSLWSIETYYRLLAPELLPRVMERILYLDIDIIINGSLDELYFTDFEEKYFAACEDNSGNIDVAGKNKAWGRNSGVKYFNAGVLLFNLVKLREDYSYSHYYNVAEKMNFELEYVDQDLLNYIFGDKVKYMDYTRYNKMVNFSEEEKQEDIYYPVIIHYPGPEKPWGCTGINQYYKLWWEYAENTEYYKTMEEDFIKEFARRNHSILERYQKYYAFFNCWVSRLSKHNMEYYLKRLGYRRIGIYGCGEIGKRLIETLAGSSIRIEYIADREKPKAFPHDIPFCFPDEKFPDADVLIVTPFYNKKEILEGLNYTGKAAGLDDIVNADCDPL